MSAGLLDTIVKLASIGASGICIFAIFWIGWLISRPREKATVEDHKTLRFYMITCVFIALVSAGSGVANAVINANINAKLQNQNRQITDENIVLVSRANELEAQVEINEVFQEKYVALEKEHAELESQLRSDPLRLAQKYLTDPGYRFAQRDDLRPDAI